MSKCWLDTKPYRMLAVNHRQMGAHRWAYEIFNGALKQGWVVHHTCEEPRCYNPNHLRQERRTTHQSHHSTGVPKSKPGHPRNTKGYWQQLGIVWASEAEYHRYSRLANKWVAAYIKE